MRYPLNSYIVLVNTNLIYRLHSRYQSTVEFQLSAKGAGDMNLEMMILKPVNYFLPHVYLFHLDYYMGRWRPCRLYSCGVKYFHMTIM